MTNYTYKNKKIGSYNEDQKVFRKKVKKSKHLLKIMDAWGIQSSVIEDLEKKGCVEIRIKEEESGVVYTIPFSHFQLVGVERDFGDGKQQFVSRKYFKQHGTT